MAAIPISTVFERVRKSYLNDPNGRRFTDDVIRGYFHDALGSMYLTSKRAFYGLGDAADIAELQVMTTDELVKKPITDIIAPEYIAQLVTSTWNKSGAAQQRGRVAPDQAAMAQQQIDSAGSA